jgi:hypothetical protein
MADVNIADKPTETPDEDTKLLGVNGDDETKLFNIGAVRSVVLAEEPPFTSAVVPYIFVFNDEEVDDSEFRTVDLSSIVPNALELKVAMLKVEAGETGGIAGFNVDVFPVGDAISIYGESVETGGSARFFVPVPLDEGEFRIKVEPLGVNPYASVTITFICGFR